MNLAVSFYSGDPSGIPNGWPKQVRELGSLQGPLLDGETLMTLDSLREYQQRRQADYDSWQASQAQSAKVPQLIEAVNSEALRRIVGLLGYAPEQQTSWLTKEVNMTARSAELLRKQINGAITPDEVGELDAMESFFAKVKSIRAFSNQLTEEIQAGGSPDIHLGWPY